LLASFDGKKAIRRPLQVFAPLLNRLSITMRKRNPFVMRDKRASGIGLSVREMRKDLNVPPIQDPHLKEADNVGVLVVEKLMPGSFV
jgi:hypothetical protein